jgi:two-component system alkaline phosphatase synthesis response regulator PhoP/two-component system response regulator VicR
MTESTPRSGTDRPIVLVCDDERHIVRLIQVNLERMGYDVVTAFDGREAIEKLRTITPTLIMLDVMMPHVDGYEVLRSIRKNPETTHIPVIMLTVQAQEGDEAAGLKLGANMYMTKPFNPQDLRRFLEQRSFGSSIPS